jgi:glycosyltransferase involved in cell wall biosynthesis
VVVAAKDEEENIGRCVRTLLGQDYPNFHLIVANDRSDDRTGEEALQAADGDERFTLLTIRELPDGWAGKNNAMQQAIASRASEYICMIDADCAQTSPSTLSVAVERAIDERADMLSILPTLEMKGFWENVIQPVCSGVMMIWCRPERVNDPDRPDAYANGAFMLIRRDAYERIGTHEAVKPYIQEDLVLARLVKSGSMRLRVLRGEGLYTVRMYTSLVAILRGWTRIFLGTLHSVKRLIASIALVVVMSLLPYGALVAAGAVLLASSSPSPAWWACLAGAAIATAMQLTVIARFWRLAGARPWLFWTYPLGCAGALWALVSALAKHRPGATVRWRGKNYKPGEAT